MTQTLDYAKMKNASKEITMWLSTVMSAELKKRPKESHELEHVIDYLCSSQGPKKLRRMSYAQANTKALEWSKAQQKRGKNMEDGSEDIRLIHDFLDGSTIVQLLTDKAFKREGFLMSHCVGSYNPKESTIYSYRDAKNMPHATFEVVKDGGMINQIKGKGNGPIHPKYIHPIIVFLKSIGMEVRPPDMANLGYVHVPLKAVELINLYVDESGQKAKFTTLFGESYLYAEAK